MKIEGYEGICSVCLMPIENGDGMKIRKNGWNFHKKCVDECPEDPCVMHEKIEADKV